MTVKYKVGRAKFGGEEKTFPKLVPGETVTGEQFQQKVAQGAARGLADVVAVFIAMSEVLREELRDEQSVQVPGIGIFTLSLKGELDDDERLIPQSAKLKVKFRPERDLTGDVNTDQSFEYVGD